MTKLQFRVLYREFLFRLVDREVLSLHAQGDPSKLLGQFAAILILLSFPFTLMALAAGKSHMPHETVLVSAWNAEHALIATTMLIVGLFAVLSWDSTFPDRRDVLILTPLPLRASTIFFAKAASLAAALGITVLVFNAVPGLVLPLVIAPPSSSLLDMILMPSLYRAIAAYWITMPMAGGFIFCCMLGLQGIAAQLPRRWFLRLSAFLQMGAFCVFVGVYFLQPSLASPEALSDARNQPLLAWLPPYWFLGLFQELNGSLNNPAHSRLLGLAAHAWIGLALAVLGACVAFLLSYFRTLRKIAEQPDIVPGFRRLTWLPPFGNSLETAIVQFSIRTLFRSRQHRVILSFYAGMGFAILILFLKTPVAQALSAAPVSSPWHRISVPLIASSFLTMCFWMMGVRAVFAIPLELRANWVFRITRLRGAAKYLKASRRAMFVLALAPVWLTSTAFFWLWPLRPAVEHFVVLVLLGITLAELCLHGFEKIPFTCSYLPGKSNLHITFWLCLMLGLNAVYWSAEFERRVLFATAKYAWTIAVLCAAAICARWRTTVLAKSEHSTLRFEEERSPVILALGLHGDAGNPFGA